MGIFFRCHGRSPIADCFHTTIKLCDTMDNLGF
jgi:hypothetical protein